MLTLLFAQIAPTADAIVIGIVVVGLSSLLQLALAAKQLFGGNKGERQIEPTQLAGITSVLNQQTDTLNNINRETGELKTQIRAVDAKIDVQTAQVDKAFQRINAISIESAGVKARIEDHLQDHREGRFDA